MITSPMILSILLMSYIAFGCLALAMFSHYRDTFSTSPTTLQSRLFYWVGWLLLGSTLLLSINNIGVAYGSVVFVGAMAPAGLLIILTLSYKAKSLPVYMLLSFISMLAFLGISFF
ncbi:DUF3325 domain-containing protein [Shewanella sp. UCD-KL12]|uniref:DUF3325 domain-containing protein n=1 Tax=Shewanella sp. UCD-KL12 TaxID=1917163 RepID=UPI002116E631|nr:DUF3325 domain-containing protein [Shewanella sp. UCD-KL12]